MIMPWYVFYSCLALGGVLAGCMIWLLVNSKHFSPFWKFTTRGLGLIGGYAAIVVLVIIQLTFAQGGKGVLIDDTGRVLGHVPPGSYYVSWPMLQSPYAQSYDVQESRLSSYSSSVSMLVNDPILRETRYELTVDVGHSTEAYVKAIKAFSPHLGDPAEFRYNAKLAEYISGLMHEFNQFHSDQLKDLYKPEEPAQQAQFERAVHAALDDELQTHGLVLTKTQFWLAN